MKAIGRLDELEGIFFEDLVDDYEGIWRLARMVRDFLGTDDPNAVREVTLKLVKDWLSADLIQPGMARNDGGFDAWSEESEEAVDRIRREWEAMNSTPSLGDITWFSITPKGERLVKERLKSKR